MDTTLAPEIAVVVPLAYTVKAAALAVGMSESYIRAQIRNGDLPVRRAGDKPLIIAAELSAWLGRLPRAIPAA